MGFLFGFALTCVSSLFIIGIWYVTPLRKFIPWKYVWGVTLFSIFIGGWSTMNAYGPRNDVSIGINSVYVPEGNVVESKSTFIEEPDRVTFSERINKDSKDAKE